jgi:hypothetical protein
MSAPGPNPYAPPQISTPQTPLVVDGKPFAACPACGNTYAKPIGFTWWGGALGPWLFTHVRCSRCSQDYNGKTGKSNDTAIAIYIMVSLGVGLVIGVGAAVMQMNS